MRRTLIASLAIGLVTTMASDASAQFFGLGSNNYRQNTGQACGPSGCFPVAGSYGLFGSSNTQSRWGNGSQFNGFPNAACPSGRCGNSTRRWQVQTPLTCGPNGCYPGTHNRYDYNNTSPCNCANGSCSLHGRDRYNVLNQSNPSGFRTRWNSFGSGFVTPKVWSAPANRVQPIDYYGQQSITNTWNSTRHPTSQTYRESNHSAADDAQLF